MGNVTKTKQFFTVTQAGEELGMTRVRVWQRIKEGKMKAVKLGDGKTMAGQLIIPAEEVQKFRRQLIKDLETQLSTLKKREEAGK